MNGSKLVVGQDGWTFTNLLEGRHICEQIFNIYKIGWIKVDRSVYKLTELWNNICVLDKYDNMRHNY